MSTRLCSIAIFIWLNFVGHRIHGHGIGIALDGDGHKVFLLDKLLLVGITLNNGLTI